MYPNPTTAQFVIELPDTKAIVATVRMIATNGDVLTWPAVLVDGRIYVDNHIAAGAYSLEVITSDAVFTSQVVVQ